MTFTILFLPQVTALISRLAMFPHPYLHEFLLNPMLPTAASARTLYTVVAGVLARAKRETGGIGELDRKISACRVAIQ